MYSTYFSLFLLLSYHLITKDVDAMVGGQKAELGKWPFFAWFRTGSRSCGAVIINERSILTLASCFKLADLNKIKISVGSVEKVKGTRIGVTHACISTAFNKSTVENFEDDFAILRLEKPLKFDANINRVETDPNVSWDQSLQSKCYALSTGFYNTDMKLSDHLYYNQVKLRHCIGKSRESVFCLRHLGAEAGVSCEGDLGSPVVCQRNNSSVLVGLISGVAKVCQPYSASLGLTEVSNFHRFLNTNYDDCIKWYDSIEK